MTSMNHKDTRWGPHKFFGPCGTPQRPRRDMIPTFLQRILIASSLLIILTPYVAHAALSEEQAIALANKELVKWRVHLPSWTVELQKSRTEWERKRSSWEEYTIKTNSTWPKARIAEIEKAMTGKEVWSVVYNRKVPPDAKVFHTHAIVFLDATTGEVLAVINPEE
jgi:hypothetical protein